MSRAGKGPETGFGQRLRELREAKQLSQKSLADLAGIRGNMIWRFETGRNSPSWAVVIVLANALGVGVEEFLVAGMKVELPPPRGRPKKQPRKKKGSSDAR